MSKNTYIPYRDADILRQRRYLCPFHQNVDDNFFGALCLNSTSNIAKNLRLQNLLINLQSARKSSYLY